MCPRRIDTQSKICFYQKIHNFYPIITKLGQNEVLSHEYLILTKFRNDWVKIVAFLIKVSILLGHTVVICACTLISFNKKFIFKKYIKNFAIKWFFKNIP